MSADQILFVDYQVPSLPAGDYRVRVTQTIEASPRAYTADRTFTVAGDRFTLPPRLVGAVFPPNGSEGDHSHVLPHVLLNRASLPWERSPDGSPVPWLALLLFTDAEKPEPRVLDLAAATGVDPYLPAPAPPAPDAQRVTVIDVPRDLLVRLMPTRADLPLLAHLRRGDGPDTAIVAGNRLPPAGTSSTVHLVSLEGRFTPGGEFDAGTGSTVRLVTLLSWRFSCVDEGATFGRLVAGLTRAGGPLRLPDLGQATADILVRQGYVPVRHHLRGGGRSVAWYRGPFTIGPPADAPDPDWAPARTADELLRYHPATGMFNVSHAAAWETGRLLALRSTGFATALYGWKRQRDAADKRSTPPGYPLLIPHLDAALPSGVRDWLAGLARLEGVPTGLLVPDARLLPAETVRFFQLDQEWMRHLIDGAYSIGRVGSADAAMDGAHPLPVAYPTASGALIRSAVVSSYAGLAVDGYADADATTPLTPVRVARLTPGIMLCLYEGDLARLDVHQQPEALHFGVELRGDGTVTKRLRGPGPDAPDAGELRPVPLGAAGTVPLRQLADLMAARLGTGPFSSGALARQLIETGERVTFLRG